MAAADAMDEAQPQVDIMVTAFDVEAHVAETRLIRLFGLDPQRARTLVHGLPKVVKRHASGPVAERYVEALRSIGAEVQLIPSETGPPRSLGPGPAVVSLPAPPSSIMEGVHRSLRIERETEEAIARFRASESMAPRTESESVLDIGSEQRSAPDRFVSIGPDPMNPRIPRAPRTPNLRGMANAAPDGQPDELGGEPGAPEYGRGDGRGAGGGGRPSWQPDAGEAVSQPHLSYHSGATRHSARAQRQTGSALDKLQSVRAAQLGRRRAERRRMWLAGTAVVAAVLAGAGLWLREPDATDQLRSHLQREGIATGELQPAGPWLRDGPRSVDGIETGALYGLIDALERAGARAVYAVRIEGDRAEALVVELPRDPDARRTVLWQAARAMGREIALTDDPGHRFLEIQF